MKKSILIQIYLLQGIFPASEVTLETFNWTSGEQLERAVFVDKTVQVLKISIKGGLSNEDVHLNYPNGKFTL